jgi:branched-chain amino acid transport system ATP-binding protein
MLNVENINVYYGQIHSIKGISFTVGDGEIVSLIGSNGRGKSTTLKTISALMRSTTGSIMFKGENISKAPPHTVCAMGIAHVPEDRRIFLQMTVEENLQMGAYTRKDDRSKDMLKMYELFPILKERRSQTAGTLSGGEQQMLAIARRLMSRPKLLILDEPSMGLAPILVEQIFDIIKKLHESGMTILLVEQNAEMALSIRDRAYVLESGKIVLSGTGKELINSPKVKKAYLGGN